MWNRYFIPDMNYRINYLYIELGGDCFMVRNPARSGSLHKYMEEVRLWQRKARRTVYLMGRVDLLPMVLK